jgi:hypothetical protein
MSPEILKTMKPSPFRIGEGCQDWNTKIAAMSSNPNDDLSSHRHGGVGGHGMFDEVLVLREEVCCGGRHSLTAETSGQAVSFPLAGAEVGAVHTSNEAANPRGAKGPYLVDAHSEAQDR